MEQLESFQIDDVRFVCDIRAGKDRGKSKDGEFVLGVQACGDVV